MSAIFTPSAERIEAANLTRFIRFVREREGLELAAYEDLYDWSVRHSDRFWLALWEFCGVRASGELEPVVTDFDRMPGARWFPSARLNFAQNLLRHRDDRPALLGRSESGRQLDLSYAELHAEVARVAAGLRQAGVQRGDRVAAFMPNIPETVIGMLAAASLGAVWSSCSPDFGLQGVLDRFG
ncbi:MAG: AMP-binding protein, partial [Xanthomonadales bacterium]|nr:AMP-binding protein [Xanthomonadales bacterium]